MSPQHSKKLLHTHTCRQFFMTGTNFLAGGGGLEAPFINSFKNRLDDFLADRPMDN